MIFEAIKVFTVSRQIPVVYSAARETYMSASMAQLDARPTGDQEVADSTPPGRQHSFVQIDHEIFSTAILSLPLIQEEKLTALDMTPLD